ncbi:MAG: TetR/AcrR family transcriptional regulator [Eggerthellaceae bacterium]|nr:TetR/AcrR family transcriptional regulator [Eggerthellaceae bacterium]
MPRPRKDDPQSAATAKIEAAFWRLLEEVGYSEITVRRVSQAAGTNRNSFYYHYEDLEDLARKAFLNNAAGAHPLISSLIEGFRDGGAQPVRPDEGVVEHARRVMLCARSESSFLRGMVSGLLRDIWFGELGIDGKLLSTDDRVQVEFIFTGLVAVLGGAEAAESPLVMARLAASPMGRASMMALREMAAAQSDGTLS